MVLESPYLQPFLHAVELESLGTRLLFVSGFMSITNWRWGRPGNEHKI